MAKAYISFHSVALESPKASSALGRAVYADVLDFTSGQDTTNSALTAAMAQNRDMVASITVDADAYIATGSTPDCDATAETAATSAKVMVPYGDSVVLYLAVGEKVAAKAVA
jgi:hypothetical protein